MGILDNHDSIVIVVHQQNKLDVYVLTGVIGRLKGNVC